VVAVDDGGGGKRMTVAAAARETSYRWFLLCFPQSGGGALLYYTLLLYAGAAPLSFRRPKHTGTTATSLAEAAYRPRFYARRCRRHSKRNKQIPHRRRPRRDRQQPAPHRHFLPTSTHYNKIYYV